MTNYSKNKYNELFKNESEKANAFDKIANVYYYGNFGRIQKSDFDVLMFSIYLDKILEKSEDDMKTYSDYELSKLLGITQSKVSNLKVKKELQYPFEKFDWRKSFNRLLDRARFDDGKIKINIPDRNLYNEIKNAIEINGGYIEKQLNAALLQVPIEYYLDLVYSVSEENDKDEIIKKLNKHNQNNKVTREAIEKKSIKDIMSSGLKDVFKELTLEIVRKKSSTIADIVETFFDSKN